jgi:hypothetical protein
MAFNGIPYRNVDKALWALGKFLEARQFRYNRRL